MYKSTSKFCFSLFFFPVICFCATPLELGGIPENEREAQFLLEDGIFDSTIWEMLRPYYSQPISVPDGELRFLKDIFPQLSGSFPATIKSLKKYEPWGKHQINSFFNDYPELLLFEPILSFATVSTPHWASASFQIYQRSYSQDPQINTGFSFFPAHYFSVKGKAGITEERAWWQRRSVSGTIPEIGEIHAGNFSLTLNEGLFYGYFPSVSKDSMTLRDNWLYGETRTWNGAALQIALQKSNEFLTFFHSRYTESVIGAKASFTPLRGLKLYFGASGLEINDLESRQRDTLFYIHTGTRYSINKWDLDCHAGISVDMPSRVPFKISVRQQTEDSRLGLSLTRIPDNLNAPRSRLSRRLHNRLEIDEVGNEDIYELQFEFSHEFNDYFGYQPIFGYTYSKSSASFNGIFTFRGKMPIEYVLRYHFHPGIGDILEYHRLSSVISRDINKFLNFELSGRGYIKPNTYSNFSGKFTVSWEIEPSLIMAPYGSYFGNSEGVDDIAFGIIQSVYLFEKTNGEFRIEYPLEKSEEVFISAKLNFYF